MKRWLLILLALLTAAGGCEPVRQQILRIVVIPKGLTHEFWQSILRGARRAARDLAARGIPTEIIWDGPLKENDALAQIRIVDRRISTGVDGIVLAPQHSRTMVGAVERAAARGIPVVIIDSGLDPAAKSMFVKYVATDNENGGYEAARHLLHVLRESDGKLEPRLILLRYQVGSESTDKRERGFERYIEGAGALKVRWLSKDHYAGATRDTAKREALPLVNRFRDEIDGIFAPNESSANGVLDALRSLGLNKKVRLMGFDSSEPLLRAVEAGDIEGLILQDPYKMGYMGVWTLVHHIKGYDVRGNYALPAALVASYLGMDAPLKTGYFGLPFWGLSLPPPFVADLQGINRPRTGIIIGSTAEVFDPTLQVLSTGEHVITRENLHAASTRELFDPSFQEKRTLIQPLYPKR
jgi:ribose transport system substrate-binding protein